MVKGTVFLLASNLLIWVCQILSEDLLRHVYWTNREIKFTNGSTLPAVFQVLVFQPKKIPDRTSAE